MSDNSKERYINPNLQDRVFDNLFGQAEIARYDEVERRQYESSLKEYWDYTSTLETAEKKGETKGRIEGRAEGEKEKALAIARNMLAAGLQISDIAKFTGLTQEEINSLA